MTLRLGWSRANGTVLACPAPVRQYLPELVQLSGDREINPGKVFDLTLPLDRAAEGYQVMDQRTATKVLLLTV
jgi:threonine dehydrogenase-like Zn-dependent dehydrogenase